MVLVCEHVPDIYDYTRKSCLNRYFKTRRMLSQIRHLLLWMDYVIVALQVVRQALRDSQTMVDRVAMHPDERFAAAKPRHPERVNPDLHLLSGEEKALYLCEIHVLLAEAVELRAKLHKKRLKLPKYLVNRIPKQHTTDKYEHLMQRVLLR